MIVWLKGTVANPLVAGGLGMIAGVLGCIGVQKAAKMVADSKAKAQADKEAAEKAAPKAA
jgi:hypothetical protein